ncbi:MAG: YdeI/OmpD-associated family protein [Verrucomicrobiia bacterium]
MPKKDPRIDAYIAKAGNFAKPILNRVRKLVHAACPDVTETIKWHSPFFEHKGILLATPAFKRHCALIFWKGRLFLSKDQKTKLRRLISISDLPGDKTLTGYIKKAVELNESGIKIPTRPKSKAEKLVVPDYFLAALKKNKRALATFENFSPSHKREYVGWITEAKREATRAKRIEAAIKQMTEGKSRNWRYQQKQRRKG